MSKIQQQNEFEPIPGGKYSEHIHARFWVAGKHGGYLGVGRIELLEHIQESGSMNQAAKSMGMSYKKAWKLVDELNRMYDLPLVEKAQGGRSGGGSILTSKGQEVIRSFRELETKMRAFLQQESETIEF